MPEHCPECGHRLSPSEPISWEGWSFDEQSQTLTLEGAQVQLSNLEGHVLAQLIRGKGCVKRREALWQSVYSHRPESSQPNMDIFPVKICHLRRMLASMGYPNAIGTVYSQGWYLNSVEQAKQKVSRNKRGKIFYIGTPAE